MGESLGYSGMLSRVPATQRSQTFKIALKKLNNLKGLRIRILEGMDRSEPGVSQRSLWESLWECLRRVSGSVTGSVSLRDDL